MATEQKADGETKGDRPRSIPVDVKETEKTFIIAADIPGVSKDKVKVSFTNDVMTIAVDKSALDSEKSDQQETGKVLRKERSQNFQPQSIRLPSSADLQAAKAEFIDGSLILIIPKTEEKARQQKVTVQ